MIYLTLFWEFFKIGLFAVGGGMATLPFLMDLTETYGWYTADELTNMIAVSESTPGPIGVNMATYAGFHTAGIGGALAATIGLILPPLLIILVIARFMDQFYSNPYVQGAFGGIRPAVTATICVVIWNLSKNMFFGADGGSFPILWLPLLLFAAFLAAMSLPRLSKLHPAWWLALGAAVGVLLKL